MDLQTSPGSDYWRRTIGKNPGTAALLLAVLVIAVLVLVYKLREKPALAPLAPPAGPNKTGFAGSGDWPSSMPMLYLRPGPPSLCGRGWDPAASAEAEALATVGALQHESYGEGRLQGSIDAAYDSRHGLSDDQLAGLMHQGATP